MNLMKAPEPFASRIPIFVFATGFAFNAMIWLGHIICMGIIGTPPGNYYVSMPYAGLSYFHLCMLNISGFIILGLISLLFGKRKIFSVARIISSLAIGANTLLMKAILRKGHLMSMQGWVQGLQEFNPNDQEGPCYHTPYRFLLNHEALTLNIRRWNEVESKTFVPDVELVSLVGDWVLETEEYAGICRFDIAKFFSGINFYLKINGEVRRETTYLPHKIYNEDGVYKIVLFRGGWRPPESLYKAVYTDLSTSLEYRVYLEMAPDKQSFFMYSDETKKGLSLGPFVRQ
ncbi:hypothetical protein P4C99_12055 [Pontiellaceae bacterium B1224]|nr:hypothetical protein [Pontiellaceae bacterium B1224]